MKENQAPEGCYEITAVATCFPTFVCGFLLSCVCQASLEHKTLWSTLKAEQAFLERSCLESYLCSRSGVNKKALQLGIPR